MSDSIVYFAPLVTLPTIIVAPEQYRTRAGEMVSINIVSAKHDFGCAGLYSDQTQDSWHRSGRVYATRECPNDIIDNW